MCMKMTACECEHVSHFDNGAGHRYGMECRDDTIAAVVTHYGTFKVCDTCRADHIASYIIKAG